MRRLLLLLTLLVLAAPAAADIDSNSIRLQDEGTTQGQVKILNCVGEGIGCTRSGATGTLTVAGGGGGSEAETTVRKTADTANSTTSMADATGLEFSAAANSEYWVRADIYWTTSGTAVGIKLSADFTSTGHTHGGQWIVNAANGTLDGAAWNADDVTVTTAAAPFTGPNTAMLQAFLKTGANAGTWIVRFAAETTGTITIKTGSIIRYQKTL